MKKTAKRIIFTDSGNLGIRVRFTFDKELVRKIKELPGRKYHNPDDDRYWTVPLIKSNLLALNELGFIFDPRLKKILAKIKLPKTLKPVYNIPGLKGELRPFQANGVAGIDYWKGNALLADEMGLGKTIQALAYIQYRSKFPAIIVCPGFLKKNWEEEAQKWLQESIKVLILRGEKGSPIEGDPDIILINYDILINATEKVKDEEGKTHRIEKRNTGWVDYLLNYPAKIIIADESHYLKNNDSLRTIAFKRLARKCKTKLMLSGTPLDDSPIDIYNSVNIINNTIFPNEWAFKHRYMNGKHNGYGWQFKGSKNEQELHKILTDNVMIRRLKKDVLTELPDKTYSYIPLELTNRKEYTKAEQTFIAYVKSKIDSEVAKVEKKLASQVSSFMESHGVKSIQKGSELISKEEVDKIKRQKVEKAKIGGAMVQMTELRILAVKGALKGSIEWIKNFLLSGEKLVVFAHHAFVIDALMKEFSKVAVKVDGGVSEGNRHKAVKAFQNDKRVKLFIGNIKAAGVGLTLTAASNVAFLELYWNPGPINQATDRVHRITQKNAVNVYFLLPADTIMDRLARIIGEKQKTANAIIDGIAADSSEGEIITEIINSYIK